MSDFQDFLRHKFAYVAIGEFKPGKFEEARKLYQEAVSTYSKGFEGAYLLQEPDTDRGIAVIFWDRQEDMAENTTEQYQAILNEMMHLFVKPPKTSFYEVVTEVTPVPEAE
ncbi:MAG TPA: antibiotic biosynthesis monooxygenase [Oscillatoriaceae cyanobacterium M33_DOE_052]|nr:antibiotic biosynthesis monooxygenase [Oscillatoriaceae cyanobacterium M33_DOE_052]